jgi:inosine-uridine nucleoside N-ribohydrolase
VQKPLLIDVDTGIDDAFALLYALADPGARLLGVSTVAGNVDVVKATRNTRAVLALAGRADIPVWPGSAAPLLKPAQDARAVHGATGLGYATLPEPPPLPADSSSLHAVDAILQAATEHEGELILIATGPLTNIALALLRAPKLVRQVKRFVLMGGAFRVRGNVTATAEFNIWHDPEAARVTFRAFGAEGAAPLIAVGLDVTQKTLLWPSDLDALAERCAAFSSGEALGRFLLDAAHYSFELMRARSRPEALIMHDPLAVGVAIDPSFVTTEAVYVDVETIGELTRGMTVVDDRPHFRPPPNAEIAVGVEAERFIGSYVEAIERLAREL